MAISSTVSRCCSSLDISPTESPAVIAEICVVATSLDLYLQASHMKNEPDKIIGVTGAIIKLNFTF